MTQTGLRDFYLKMWYKRKRDFDGMTLRLPYKKGEMCKKSLLCYGKNVIITN